MHASILGCFYVILILQSSCQTGEEFWTAEELQIFAQTLHHQIAELHVENAWLRKQVQQNNASKVVGIAPPVLGVNKTIGPNVKDDSWVQPSSMWPPDALHGSTLFATMCVGEEHFRFYCAPFLTSFERAYRSACKYHQVAVFFADVDPRKIAHASSRFAPWVRFIPLPDQFKMKPLQGVALDCSTSARSCEMQKSAPEVKDSAVSKNNGIFPSIVAEYLSNAGQGFCHSVVIDSDTLIVRPLGPYLNDCNITLDMGESQHGRQSPDQRWDVAFTVYDSEFIVPWADNAEQLGKTPSGLSRINSGVVLLNLQNLSRVCFFLNAWSRVSETFAEDVGGDWFEEFKGPSQAGLASLVSSFDIETLPRLLGWRDKCRLCAEPVEVRLPAEGGDMHVRFRAFPARILNHAESMIQGKFPAELMVVHLKGIWWRALLTGGGRSLKSTTRTLRWNRDSLMLHELCLDIWESSLGTTTSQ